MPERAKRKTGGRGLAGPLAILAFALAPVFGQTPPELPRPTYANSLIISLEHPPSDAAEIDYIKANFPFGLYAWPSLSVTHVPPSLAWGSDLSPEGADAGIAAFKTTVDSHINAAKAEGVKFHLVVCSGLARSVGVYADAKTEDVRNAQWFNDNNMGTAAQVTSSEAMTRYIFGTFSRYARKLRANLEAKSHAVFAFLKLRMDENPATLVAVSGWGEAEMSDRRIDGGLNAPQQWFCDYSPFAVLEFRDWIKHEGLYDDATGPFAGQGWSGGGVKYQGSGGLGQFNTDFGTVFTSWDLKYYHWSLLDNWESDSRSIPLASYVQDGMMPTSGTSYISGGFDPPRTMTPGDGFYDLWNLFRETMVRNLVLDTAGWAAAEGIPADRWYSHQIPADYIFGSKPDDPMLNARYYTSASPLWTAGILPYGSTGASIYDVKYPADENHPTVWFARTTQYVFPAISAMSANWGILEYDPETYPGGDESLQSPPSDILDQYLRAYSYGPHLINFWRWKDSNGEHMIKGLNKETALRDFIGQVRDKARSTDLNIVYTPPKVMGVSGSFGAAPAPGAASAPAGLPTVAHLETTGKIWTDETWNWTDWGDFDHFEIYRGTTADFVADAAHSVGTTTTYVFEDTAAPYGGALYYKWRAVNSTGAKGPASDPVAISAVIPAVPVLSLNRTMLYFGLTQGGAPTPAQPVSILNVGAAGTTIHWSAVSNQPWLQVTPASGTGNGVLDVSINGTGLGAGAYSGTVTVDDPLAAAAPKTIAVNLTVYAPGEDSQPFGDFSTPIHDSSVFSSIAVTGWVLDDIGVQSVAIKRRPINEFEATDPDGLIFIGNATFVRGARNDVETAFPLYPLADRAGWGYMLLTNFLPNQGNGTFTLVAVAEDTSGHKVKLPFTDSSNNKYEEIIIHVDNAGAILPFGAIDTPAQGGTASGAVYYNFGWALTPQPNSIPTNGSTIWVWLDGVPLGHPNYGHPRGDIQALFPGYQNTDTAVGVYNLNTTAFSNGVHNIAWSVQDSAGNVDGIGSRFFNIMNAGAPGAAGAPAEARLPETARGDLGLRTRDATRLRIEEMGRVRIGFAAPKGARVIGWGETPDRPLPVGSTLDAEGRFWWIPGPGFIGRYTFHFAATDGTLRGPAVEVVVDIVPGHVRRASGPLGD